MSHIALYRSWRPQSFSDMVGQQHIIQTLQNAIREQRVSHAYLFNGPRGTGKTTTAKVLAKAVNCEHGPAVEPCNACAACLAITEGHSIDVIEIDAASNRGIDEIRDIRDKVRYAPTEVRMKVYIIDEVHMLTAEAFNALLKTLEEPPAHVIFILATTEPHKIPATIISRCQRFDFRQVSLEEQVARLQLICDEEHIVAESEALAYIARLSEGGMRDAISLLEQSSAYGGGQLTLQAAIDVTGGIAAEQFYSIAQAIMTQDVASLLKAIEDLLLAGKSADKCLENLIYYFRDLLIIKLAPQAQLGTERLVNPQKFVEMATTFTNEQLFSMIETLNHYQNELRVATQPQTILEVALLKLVSLQLVRGNNGGQGVAQSDEVNALRSQVQKLETQLQQMMKQGVTLSSQAEVRTERAPAKRSFASQSMSRTKVKLGKFVDAQHSQETNQARMNWPQVMQRIKEAKITVHAWLKDSELVSVADGQFVLTFKNDIHRETTEKASHRELIEKVASEFYGQSCTLVTVMLKEWQDATKGQVETPNEVLQLESELIDANSNPGQKPAWVEEAEKMFEGLVVIEE